MTSMTIWGTGTPRSFRPIWVAEELGIEYEHRAIGPRTGETQTPEYQRLNRKQKIPFLQDGEIKISESVAICRYLREKYGNGSIYQPDTPVALAKEDEWCCYIYGELDETSLYVMRRHGDLGAIYGDCPEAVTSSRGYAEKHFGVIAELLATREFLMADHFSVPDILLMSCLDWAVAYEVALPQGLIDYHARLSQRPAYLSAMQINYPDLFGG